MSRAWTPRAASARQREQVVGERLRDRLRVDLARERREDPLPFWVFVGLVVAGAVALFVVTGPLLWNLVLAGLNYR